MGQKILGIFTVSDVLITNLTLKGKKILPVKFYGSQIYFPIDFTSPDFQILSILTYPAKKNLIHSHVFVIYLMNYNIRFAGKEDAVTIAEISHQTFYDSFADDNSEADMEKFLGEQFTKGKLILEVGAPENTFLLASDDLGIVGYAKLRDSKKPLLLKDYDSLEIARLYALKNKIGLGVGKALMHACIDLAKELNKQLVWLGVWEKNLRAIDFYHKWGFEKFDETDFLLGDDVQRDWLMKKKV